MKILVIDNYDSFTYNLVYILRLQGGVKIEVIYSDKVSLQNISELKPDKILLSPGPGRPENAGAMPEVIEFYCQSIPILGICLGMQAIAFLYGAEIVKCRNPFHGKTSEVFHDSRTLFRGIPQGFRAMRYHSLIIERKELNSEIEVSAWTNDGIIMGLRHKSLPLEGVQFHPESILTESGDNIIRNWLKQ